jgi:ACS family allantoate permease-like MFS transporter
VELTPIVVLYIDSLSFVLPMSLISSNIAGFTKKSTASTIFFIGYCLGQFSGPQFFKTSEAPRYPTGFKALYTAVSLSIGFGSILMVYLWWMNKKRDRKDMEDGSGVDGINGEEVTAADFLDMTDWERRDFRYVW